MRITRSALIPVASIIVVAAALMWFLARGGDSTPFAIPDAALSGWTLVTSDGTDPWIVGAKPPDALTTQLFREVSRRAGKPLVAPAHPALPLVLRSEFDDGLQGVYGTDSVLRIARDAGMETATFRPVCLAHRTSNGSSGRAEVYFVPFESPAFNQLRVDLVPPQPEHAGIGVYEPGTLTPILVVGATDRAFDRWWPLQFDPATDCEADLASPTSQN